MMRSTYWIVFVLLWNTLSFVAQNDSIPQTDFLSYEEYIGYVKKYHPTIKQANLKLNIGEAALLRARGGFDPKIEVDFDRKKFANTEYFNKLNTTFKIPTWYGVEFKANFEENSGNYLNPEATLPDGGLYSAGVSVSLAQGFLINERMAAVKKAKIFMQQTKAERELAVNALLVKASEAYFMWLEAYQEQKIYHRFLKNAAIRLEGIKRNVVVGEKAPIDSVEAKITMQSRRLNAEQAKLKTRKAMLYASNYLWMANIPVQIQENITPVIPEANTITTSLSFKTMEELEFAMANHPKIRNLESKIAALEVDNTLKKNKLLPKVDLQYNFLASDIDAFSNFNTANYKAFVNVSFPLFLRKERGDLKLNKYKLQEIKFERTTTALAINNKIEAIQTEISSLEEQTSLIEAMVVNYTVLLAAEERKFTLGDSSLFVINAREQKLIAAALKANTITVKTLLANVSLFEAYGKANLNDTNYNSNY